MNIKCHFIKPHSISNIHCHTNLDCCKCINECLCHTNHLKTESLINPIKEYCDSYPKKVTYVLNPKNNECLLCSSLPEIGEECFSCDYNNTSEKYNFFWNQKYLMIIYVNMIVIERRCWAILIFYVTSIISIVML